MGRDEKRFFLVLGSVYALLFIFSLGTAITKQVKHSEIAPKCQQACEDKGWNSSKTFIYDVLPPHTETACRCYKDVEF